MKPWHILIYCSFLLLGSCQTDSKADKKANTLLGKWILVEGHRSGKKTESLKDTYFAFEETTMSTNLPIPGATESTYVRKENVISQTIVNDLIIDYTIQEMTEQQLKLTTKLRGYDFTFLLERAAE